MCQATVRSDRWAWVVSVVAQDHVFTSFAGLKKKIQLVWTFFQLLANDDVTVNVTQRISTKIHSELDSLSRRKR